MIPDPTSREARHREWFDSKAPSFADAVAIELPFLGLDERAQERLNRFKWWALSTDHLVEWHDREVLEFGAGQARFAVELPGYRSYLGIDYAPNMVRIGQERLQRLGLGDRARLELGDCLEFDGPAESYDLVCGLGLLSYLDDIEAVIRKMAYHTRPGGSILLDFRHATPVYTLIREVKWRVSAQTGGGNRGAVSKNTLRRMFKSAGMTDVTFVMREYPFLDELYSQRGWDRALDIRQALARRSWLDWLGMIGFVAARKPK